MAKNNLIDARLYGQEIGRIGLDDDGRRSSFQFNPDYLQSSSHKNIFPSTGIIKRVEHVQMFSQYNNITFKGLPPQIADSLPDMFGSIIFKAWLDTKNRSEITSLEQLAYVGHRGMGAIEYAPITQLPAHGAFDIEEIIDVLREVLDVKRSSGQRQLNTQGITNIFRLGTSAGGVRPKILISEHKETAEIIPGDVEYSDHYHHYLVKLAMEEDFSYPRETIEYCYYRVLVELGVNMMDSKLIDSRHFATLRYDRVGGEKKHVLTATGITGWDYKSPEHSSYENLFKLCSFLKVSQAQMEELFKRMVFNVVYGNVDDHLKNHSFIHDPTSDRWSISPAYDITFPLNPLLNFKRVNRALSINGKRNQIGIKDILTVADRFTIKNPSGVVRQVVSQLHYLKQLLYNHGVSARVIDKMEEQFNLLGM
jgi:serine/threonine-protein kinase HipA